MAAKYPARNLESTRANARLRKGEQTRERIIAAAAPIFNQHGYEGTSMQDLMAATGLEKGGLYRHFSSKEELAAEAFHFALDQAVKLRTGNLNEIPGALARLRHIIERFVEIPSPVAGGCPLMNTAIDTDDGNPVLRDLAAQALRRWLNSVAKIAAEGIASGEIRTDVEPRRIANIIISTLEGALMLSRIERTRAPLQDARITLEDWLNSLRATARR
jgi:TetR/AcrR family transcriptional regulator, transcriptional repressor for nem operon